MSNIHSRVEVLFQHILQHGSIFQRIILLIHHNCVEINIKLPKTKLVGVMFLSLKSRHTCVSIGRGPVRRLRVYTSVQCRQRAHGTDPCRVLMRCWLGLSCKLWCNATKLTSPRDVTSSKYENVSTCCKL